MKVMWKKEKKRPIGAIPSNLPFEFNQQTEQQHQQQQEKTELNTNKTQQDKEEDHSSFSQEDKEEEGERKRTKKQVIDATDGNESELALSFLSQGNKLAEEGKYREALGKWEASLNCNPDNAILHEQKAQILLEVGDAWSALKAATRATKLDPKWAEAWITLGRAQLNFGEPDSAIESFDKALVVKPELKEAQDDRKTALNLVKRRKQLHSSGLSSSEVRFVVGDKTESL